MSTVNYSEVVAQLQTNYQARMDYMMKTYEYHQGEYLHALVSVVLTAVGASDNPVKFLVSDEIDAIVAFTQEGDILVHTQTLLRLDGDSIVTILIGACFVQHFSLGTNFFQDKDYIEMVSMALANINMDYETQIVGQAVIQNKFRLPKTEV